MQLKKYDQLLILKIIYFGKLNNYRGLIVKIKDLK